MNRIVIVGHTRGLGAALFKEFNKSPAFIEVIGLSKSTGFNIEKANHRLNIIDKCKEASILVINAFSDEVKDAQHELLCEAFKVLQNRPMTIAVIGSNAPDNWKDSMRKYPSYKKMIDHSVRQMSKLDTPCRVVNFRPGWINTTRIRPEKRDGAMDPASVALTIRKVLELPGDIRPVEFTFVPEKYRDA